MRFFRCKKKYRRWSTIDKLIAGVIIGGAIGSIIGKKMLEKSDKDHDESDDEDTTKNDGVIESTD